MAQQPNYIVYDLETTGFTAGKHGVCEIAMMGINSVTLKEIGRYEAIIAPYKVPNEDGELVDYEVSQGALDVNGLTMDKIRAGKDPIQVVKESSAFMKSCNAGSKKPILTGHNIIKFDNPHLDSFFTCNKGDLSKFVNSLYFIDTMLESWRMFPDATGTGQHTLAKLCERFDVDKFDAHSAMPDVIANANVFIKIQERLRNQSTQMVVEKEKNRPRDTFRF